MRYFLRLSYNGAPFCGWQRQPNAPSVQEVIEKALSMVLRRETAIVGAGRTDTGVHARCMYAHFDVPEPIADSQRFLRGLNSIVGRDIAFHELIEVAPDAHARFDATSRTYRYFVNTEKSPFLYGQSWLAPANFDFDAMNRAAEILLKTDDFTSFAKLHTDNKTNICRVARAQWVKMEEEGRWYFEITADRFLRNMVRAVVGTLADVGRGKLSEEGFAEIIAAKNRCEAGTSMPAQALFLWNVTYDFID